MDKRRGDQAEARAQRPKDEPASPPHPRLQRYQKTQTMSYKDEAAAYPCPSTVSLAAKSISTRAPLGSKKNNCQSPAA